MKTLKIVAISDTHTQHRALNIPDGDILIHAGDIMGSGYRHEEIKDFLDWFSRFPHEVKILVAGNHDRLIEDQPDWFQEKLSKYPGITYLENSGVEVAGIKIWGTPDQRIFCNWAFNRTEEQLIDIFSKIPADTNILISHAPQWNVLDNFNGRRLGEKALSERISQLEHLNLHIFGHIHEGRGCDVSRRDGKQTINSYNATVLDGDYVLKYKPFEITYKIEENGNKTCSFPKSLTC